MTLGKSHRIDLNRGARAALHGTLSALLAAAALALQPSAHADSIYDITLDTSSLAGTGATLTFDFITGGGTQSNSVSISDFSTNGTLGASSFSGAVVGTLPGPVSLTSASFFNELQQSVTLGATISFQIDATTNGPTAGALPDTLSLFLLDPSAANSLVGTQDPTGADSLLTFQIDGTPGGNVAAYSATSGLLPVTAVVASAPTAAPEIDSSRAFGALPLLIGALAVLRSRRKLGYAAAD